MARKAPRRPDWERVTPTFDGQHEDPDPVTWEIRGMPGKIRAAWGTEMWTGKQSAGSEDLDEEHRSSKAVRLAERRKEVKDGDANALEGVAPTPYALDLVIENCVRQIRNYDDADGRPIRTGRDLLSKGDSEAITEAYFAATTRTFLTEELVKNLTAQPGS